MFATKVAVVREGVVIYCHRIQPAVNIQNTGYQALVNLLSQIYPDSEFYYNFVDANGTPIFKD